MRVFEKAWIVLKGDLADQLGTWAGNQAENRAYNDAQLEQDIEAAGGEVAYLEQRIEQLEKIIEQKRLLMQELREKYFGQMGQETGMTQQEAPEDNSFVGGVPGKTAGSTYSYAKNPPT